jgi:hypothetical protein
MSYFVGLAEQIAQSLGVGIVSQGTQAVEAILNALSTAQGLSGEVVSAQINGKEYNFKLGFLTEQQPVLTNIYLGARQDAEQAASSFAGDLGEAVLEDWGAGGLVAWVNQEGQTIGVQDATGKLLSGGVQFIGQAVGNAAATLLNKAGISGLGLTDPSPMTNVFVPYIAWQPAN